MRAARASDKTTSTSSTGLYDQRISIVDGLRRAFEKFKHHREFSRRAQPFIESELPAYTVSVSCEHGRHSIRVWGAGVEYRDGVEASWSQSESGPWTDALRRAIDVQDFRDHEERAVEEQMLHAFFAPMHAEIARLRAEAALMIKSLPIPPSATVRAEPMYWEGPSVELARRFPLLFK